MRIIAGKYRGKKLKEFELSSTKPTLDRVKESIFNLIQFDVVNAIVLDLFSGTGALGIEAISRGANHTVLVDNNPKAIKLIEENLKGLDGSFKVENTDSIEYLKNTQLTFDIVLIDPPYKTDLGLIAIDFLVKNNKINDNGIIIFETSEDNNFKFDFVGYSVVKKKYGTVAVYKISKD